MRLTYDKHKLVGVYTSCGLSVFESQDGETVIFSDEQEIYRDKNHKVNKVYSNGMIELEDKRSDLCGLFKVQEENGNKSLRTIYPCDYRLIKTNPDCPKLFMLYLPEKLGQAYQNNTFHVGNSEGQTYTKIRSLGDDEKVRIKSSVEFELRGTEMMFGPNGATQIRSNYDTLFYADRDTLPSKDIEPKSKTGTIWGDLTKSPYVSVTDGIGLWPMSTGIVDKDGIILPKAYDDVVCGIEAVNKEGRNWIFHVRQTYHPDENRRESEEKHGLVQVLPDRSLNNILYLMYDDINADIFPYVAYQFDDGTYGIRKLVKDGEGKYQLKDIPEIGAERFASEDFTISLETKSIIIKKGKKTIVLNPLLKRLIVCDSASIERKNNINKSILHIENGRTVTTYLIEKGEKENYTIKKVLEGVINPRTMFIPEQGGKVVIAYEEPLAKKRNGKPFGKTTTTKYIEV